MTSRKTSEIYDTACHVLDPETVVVQGARFVRERTCSLGEPHGYEQMNLMECSACGMGTAVAYYCSWCGSKVVE